MQAIGAAGGHHGYGVTKTVISTGREGFTLSIFYEKLYQNTIESIRKI